MSDRLRQGQFVRVVNYHNTPASRRGDLRAELARLAGRFDTVTMGDLDRFYDPGRWPGERPVLLPVFYEGYRNSLVAASVCTELGLTAWFPVCTGFIGAPVDQQELFARSHDIGLTDEDLAAAGRHGRLALSWDEVARIAEQHVVLAHTASHVGLADIVDDHDVEREIRAPKRELEAVTGRESAAFVWLHGTAWSGDRMPERAVLDAGYRYLIGNTSIHRLAGY